MLSFVFELYDKKSHQRMMMDNMSRYRNGKVLKNIYEESNSIKLFLQTTAQKVKEKPLTIVVV